MNAWYGGVHRGSVYQNYNKWCFKYQNVCEYFTTKEEASAFQIQYNFENNLTRNLLRRMNDHYEMQVGDGFITYFDIEDLPFVQSKKSWTRKDVKNRPGLVYVESNDHVKLHRLITNFVWKEVDHINRNGLDNRRANLRNGKDINQKNRRKNRNNTSGRNGISPRKYKGVVTSWRLYWQQDGRQHHRTFSRTHYGTVGAAYSAACRARKKLDLATGNTNGWTV
jgi:hypothetical protein